MGYTGKKPATSAQIDSSADIVDGVIQSQDIQTLDAAKLTGTVIDARISALTASKLTGTIADARISASSVTQHVSATLLDSPVITGTLSLLSGASVTHTVANWSDDVSYTITPTNCTVGSVNASGQFVVTHTSGAPSYTIKATTASLGLADSALVTKNILLSLTAPTISSPIDVATSVNVVYTITSTDTGDNKLILDIGSSNFTYQSVSVGTASKVGNTVECIGFTTNNPAVTIQFTVEATYSVTAKATDTAGIYGDSASSSADSITIANYNGEAYYLIVAGGGGGGGGYGGGGGAGGYRTNHGSTSITLTDGVTYTVTTGLGGAGTPSQTTGGASGGNSSVTGTGVSISATGGGRAGTYPSNAALNGGSGGGAHSVDTYSNNTIGTGNAGGSGGSPSIVEGYNGGLGAMDGSLYPAGGGGGSGGLGGAGSGTSGGTGGIGKANTITNSSVSYAGGGGGGIQVNGYGGSASSGGGAGGNPSSYHGYNGTDGLGGGGGGTAYQTGYNGGDGGNGVVILKVLVSAYSGVYTGSPTVTTSTDTNYKIIKWLGNGSYTP